MSIISKDTNTSYSNLTNLDNQEVLNFSDEYYGKELSQNLTDYAKTASFLLKLAMDANDNGENFPV